MAKKRFIPTSPFLFYCEWSTSRGRFATHDEIHAVAVYITNNAKHYRLCHACSQIDKFKKHEKYPIHYPKHIRRRYEEYLKLPESELIPE